MRHLAGCILAVLALLQSPGRFIKAQTTSPDSETQRAERLQSQKDQQECSKQFGEDRQKLLICLSDRLAARQAAAMRLKPEFYRTVFVEWLIDVTTLSFFAGVLGMLVLKFFARKVSLFRLWWISFYPLWGIFIFYGATLFCTLWFDLYVPMIIHAFIAAGALLCAIWLTARAFKNVKTRPITHHSR